MLLLVVSRVDQKITEPNFIGSSNRYQKHVILTIEDLRRSAHMPAIVSPAHAQMLLDRLGEQRGCIRLVLLRRLVGEPQRKPGTRFRHVIEDLLILPRQHGAGVRGGEPHDFGVTHVDPGNEFAQCRLAYIDTSSGDVFAAL